MKKKAPCFYYYLKLGSAVSQTKSSQLNLAGSAIGRKSQSDC